MSSLLEEDKKEFELPCDNQDTVKKDIQLDYQDSEEQNQITQFVNCEICKRIFQCKKDLRIHILEHLRQPRIVLERIVNVKSPEESSEDKNWMDSENKKGTFKITFKRKSSSCESLKLKLKKSSVSESFTVVSNSVDNLENLDTEEGPEATSELASSKENDVDNDSTGEKSPEESFENVILNQENEYENDNFEEESEHNPLESIERPIVDNNEGDSGVGSDTVNPLEKEDQNVDDNYSNSEHADATENDDPENEEPDPVEATCRETIENLKKLGEESRFFSSRSAELTTNTNESIADEAEEIEEAPQKSPESEEESEDNSANMIEELKANSQISLVPKSSLISVKPVSTLNETEILPIGGSNSFNWSKISEDSRNKNRDEMNERNKENSDDCAGTLLQNFLKEHQQRELNNSNHDPLPLETEYVSLESLAETVNTCKVCNEKFKDIAHLDAHRSKAGHYQCNVPDCVNLIFNTPMEVSKHKAQAHGAPLSPSITIASNLHNSSLSNSPRLNQNSPHANQHSPHLNMHSPHMNSPHSPSMNSHAQGSPNSPGYNSQQLYPPISLEQLPAPVQQLAQQVQRMPLPQSEMPPGSNAMMPGPGYYAQPPGRPPLYRVHAPIQYPGMGSVYQQYGPNPYQQYQVPPQMQQQIPRQRYPAVMPNQRSPRVNNQQPQQPHPLPPAARPRVKRPLPPQQSSPQSQQPVGKQRRMDVLLPDRNEDADCHVIAQQKRNDGLPVIQNVQGGATVQSNRLDPPIHLTDAITLSVRQPAQVNAMAKEKNTSAVANALAARGITVTAASKKSSEQNNNSPPQKQNSPLSTLNLSSAISILPASNSQRKQQEQTGQFAVPQSKQSKQNANDVDRPPRPPTVDLTQEGSNQLPMPRRGRPPSFHDRMIQSLTCQVCDKRFQTQEQLTQHMATHRATNKLLHKCNLCAAQYPTAAALLTHKRTYHNENDATLQNNGNIELALPVVDLKSTNSLNRLFNLGIQSYIPLSQLSAQTGGYYALPIVSIDGARNPNSNNLAALGATSILSLGPLKHLPNTR